jgi:phosphoenolpyruvate carboxylase
MQGRAQGEMIQARFESRRALRITINGIVAGVRNTG